MLAILCVLSSFAAPFGDIPVQGIVLDAGGAPPSGPRALTFRLRAGTTSLHVETVTVDLVSGGFAAALSDVDLAALRTDGPLSLSVTLDGVESPAAPVAWAPRAAYALDAASLGGLAASAYAVRGEITWSDLDEATIPPLGTYAAGDGLALTGNVFSVVGGGGGSGPDVALTAHTLGTCPGAVAQGTIAFDGTTFKGCGPSGWVPLSGGSSSTADGSAGSPALSCKQLNLDRPALGSGTYWLAGGGTPHEAYCDMTPGNAGWTLVLRTAASASAFTFRSTHWTSTSTLNTASPSPTAAGDAKYRGFNELLGSEIRGCIKNNSTGTYGCKAYAYTGSRTLLSLFQTTPIGSDSTNKGLFFTETEAERLQWLTMMGLSLADTSSGLGAPYVRTGINLDDDISCFNTRVRFGILINNQGDVNTANDAGGFGASGYGEEDCGVVDSFLRVGSGLATTAITERPGTLWVR